MIENLEFSHPGIEKQDIQETSTEEMGATARMNTGIRACLREMTKIGDMTFLGIKVTRFLILDQVSRVITKAIVHVDTISTPLSFKLPTTFSSYETLVEITRCTVIRFQHHFCIIKTSRSQTNNYSTVFKHLRMMMLH